MPSERFAARIAQRGLTLAGIDQCAEEFAVSFEAAARRAVSLTALPACLLVAAAALADAHHIPAQHRSSCGRPTLRVVKSWYSKSWPAEVKFDNVTVRGGSLVAQAYVHRDQRHGRTGLGVGVGSGLYRVEARGYAYQLPDNPAHQQVVALVRDTDPA